jgi:dipeptidyl aminopeptidase/acylaminoacyl peptidase
MEPGDHKEVYRIQSSPTSADGAIGGGVGRAVAQTSVYALPGDKLDSYEVNVFDVASKQQYKPLGEERIDMAPDGGDARVTFEGPGANCRWKSDGTHLLFEKFDRGHQRVRLVEVDAAKGETRNVIDEKSKTFIWSAHMEALGVRPITYLRNENEIMYLSEMDGWRHFYLVDVPTGTMKQITKGQWIVRAVNRLDEDARQIWFTASGVYPDQDPYFIHYGRVNFDGSGLTWLTSGNGNHSITFGGETPLGTRGAGGANPTSEVGTEGSFSPDMKYVIDTYSRVDMPPVTELRRVDNGQIVCALEKAEVTVPWEAPEVFVAKGRDGETDIWGFISRPKNLDTTKKYAIIEDIYGGPQGSFVPKTFSTAPRYRDLTDLGFIVVKIDGMGTANRSKAFHDVCWHNLKDGGFLDRIAWIKAAADKYPYMDIARVGIYGTSAGGQNACAAVLFHPEFYKVAVANSGCHDNRMDKVSWNEQWMGYPVGSQYAECSNIDNASKLEGRLQLVVGELDTNVPPESTHRLVNALVQARKDFEFVMIPGANHGAGSPITQTKRNDFFIRYLQGIEPPNHNARVGVASD